MNSYYNAKLYPLQDKVLRAIDSLDTPFYLTGGTALSRGYYQHRYSDDLDLFVNQNPSFMALSDQIIGELNKSFAVKVSIKTASYYSIVVDEILKLDLVNDIAFHDGNFVSKPFFHRVDNVKNILSNKLSAVISRDEPKDVVDIWVIAKDQAVDWRHIFQAVNGKTVGIFPPTIAQRLAEFPIELLSSIKWVEGKNIDSKIFSQDLQQICDAMLKV